MPKVVRVQVSARGWHQSLTSMGKMGKCYLKGDNNRHLNFIKKYPYTFNTGFLISAEDLDREKTCVHHKMMSFGPVVMRRPVKGGPKFIKAGLLLDSSMWGKGESCLFQLGTNQLGLNELGFPHQQTGKAIIFWHPKWNHLMPSCFFYIYIKEVISKFLIV